MIHRISLAEVLEQTSPPSRTLDVSVLDDTAFVRVCDVTEDHREDRHREIAGISVSLPSLLEALTVLAQDAERERLRPRDRQGEHETRLSGRRFSAAPVGPWSAVAAIADHLRYEPAGDPKAEDGTGP